MWSAPSTTSPIGEGVDRVVDVDFGANLDATRLSLSAKGESSPPTPRWAFPNPTLPFYSFMFRNVTLKMLLIYLLDDKDPPARGVAAINRMARHGSARLRGGRDAFRWPRPRPRIGWSRRAVISAPSSSNPDRPAGAMKRLAAAKSYRRGNRATSAAVYAMRRNASAGVALIGTPSSPADATRRPGRRHR
jgi:hypothetical protein